MTLYGRMDTRLRPTCRRRYHQPERRQIHDQSQTSITNGIFQLEVISFDERIHDHHREYDTVEFLPYIRHVFWLRQRRRSVSLRPQMTELRR